VACELDVRTRTSLATRKRTSVQDVQNMHEQCCKFITFVPFKQTCERSSESPLCMHACRRCTKETTF